MTNENIWAKDQVTKDQAIALYNSGEWKTWTHEQVVRFQLFQKLLCVPFDRFHEAITSVLGRPVFTHEFALNYEGIVMEFLGEKPTPSLAEIIDLIPEEKRLILGL